MNLACALAASVAGAWFLQQQAGLPPAALLTTTTVVACAALLVCLAAGRRTAAGGVLDRGSAAASNIAILLGTFALGACHAAWFATVRLADELPFENEGRDVRLVGVVASLPAHLPRGTRFEFDVESVEPTGLRVPERVSLGWFGAASPVRPGERWRFTARLRRPHGSLNPGGFDLEAWMFERNLRATGYVRDGGERIDAMIWRGGYAVDRVRHVLREHLRQRLRDHRYAGVIIALVLGDQRAIGEVDWLLFSRTGISHLVSISGLHITMIAGLLALVVNRAWRWSPQALVLAPAQAAAAVAAVLAAWAYCLLAGWGVPAQRTFFMLATVAGAMLARLPARPASTLALAAFVVTLLDPWAVLAPGFWLSFGAVAAIFLALFGRPAASDGGLRARLKAAATVQLVVTVALVPLTVVLFQQVSLVSPLANAIAIPVVSLLVTPFSLLAACFVALPEPLASVAVPLLAFAHALIALLVDLLQWTLQWRWASVVLPAPPAWVAVLAVLGAGWLIAPPGWPMRWAGAIWLLPLFLWPAERPRPGELWVTALDVGQGAALVVEMRGFVLVYDTGPRYSPQADAGSRIVLPYLRSRGIERIDVLVLSHLDSDHSGGAPSILGTLDVGEVWTSIEPDEPLLANVRRVQRCRAGAATTLGDVQVRVLHPTAAEYALAARKTNARSCVVDLRAGAQRVLLTGDLPEAQEKELLARTPDLRATFATAPHHGSRSSSSEPFVRAIAPTWIVVQAGYRNRFGHPDASVIARYKAVGSTLVRTDFAGAAQWRLHADGSALLRRQRIDVARYWHNRPGRPADAADEGDDGGFDAVSPAE